MPTKALLAVALAYALTAHAQPADELTTLKQEQARLRQSLDDMDRRIRALEGANPASAMVPASAATRPISPLAALQRNWSEVKPGITKARVDELLGKPEREMQINGDLVWYYVYPGIGNGSVFFSAENRVTGAHAPRSSWSW